MSDCNEQKGEVLKDLECLSHIVIDFWFQGDLVRSLLLTGRSRAVCRFTLSIFFVLCAVGWPLYSQHDCMCHTCSIRTWRCYPQCPESSPPLSLCHATRDIAWTWTQQPQSKQMEVKKDEKSKGRRTQVKKIASNIKRKAPTKPNQWSFRGPPLVIWAQLLEAWLALTSV